MVFSTENISPPKTIQTMPRTVGGHAAKVRKLRRCASDHCLGEKKKGLRGFMQA
jgi:hypothetical protein